MEEIIDAVHYVEQNPQKIGLLPQEWSFVTPLQRFLKERGLRRAPSAPRGRGG